MRLADKLDSITIDDIAKIDLNNLNFVSRNAGLQKHIDGMPGQEHYRLLCYLSTWYDQQRLYDIGTYLGGSALSLAYTKSNLVVSYDIEYQVDLRRQPNIEFRVGDFFNDPTMLSSPLLFVDVTHDGALEQKILNHLISNNYKGLTVWDDIHLNTPMERFWSGVKQEKRDLSKLGHWSGTGAIIFE